MVRPNGEMFGGLAWTMRDENMSMLPAGPVGATQPPSSASLVTVSRSKGPERITGRLQVVAGVNNAQVVASRNEKSGPFAAVTSSRKTAMFMARGSGISSSRAQVPKSWCHCQTSPSNAALALTLYWCM